MNAAASEPRDAVNDVLEPGLIQFRLFGGEEE